MQLLPQRSVGPCSSACCILADDAAVCCCCALEGAPQQVEFAAWFLPTRWVQSSISHNSHLSKTDTLIAMLRNISSALLFATNFRHHSSLPSNPLAHAICHSPPQGPSRRALQVVHCFASWSLPISKTEPCMHGRQLPVRCK